MNTVYSFISSDYRDFYKADVYKVLSLPDDSIVHFRYKKDYIAPKIVNALHELERKKCIIIFRVCAQSLKPTNSNLENLDFPVRFATIWRVEDADDTGVVHFFLKLAHFDVPQLKSKRLPNEIKHVDSLSLQDVAENRDTKTRWDEVAKEVFEYFPTDIIVRLSKVIDSESGTEVKLTESWGGKSCYYELVKRKKYIVQLASFNGSGRKANFSFKANSEFIVLQKVNNHASDLTHDNYYIPVSVAHADPTVVPDGLELSVQAATSGPMKMTQSKDSLSEAFGFHLPILVKNNPCSSFWAGLLTSVGVAGFMLLTSLRNSMNDDGIDWWVVAIGAILLTTSTSILVHIHKKA